MLMDNGMHFFFLWVSKRACTSPKNVENGHAFIDERKLIFNLRKLLLVLLFDELYEFCVITDN